MFLGDFHPFPAVCGTLSASQNALASFVFAFIENDAQIYSSQRSYIEKALLKRIKNGSYMNIPACKAYENLLTSQKKYIVESLNKGSLFVKEFGLLTTRKLNKDIRRHISGLLVNNFLQENEHEIKQLTDEGEPEPAQEPAPAPKPEPKKDDSYDICEYCEEYIIECECYICHHCDEKMGACECKVITKKQQEKDKEDKEDEDDEEDFFQNMDEIPEDWTYADIEIHFNQLLFYFKEAKDELKGAKEIINSDKEIIKELTQERKDDKIYINDYENNFNELLKTNKKNEKEVENLKKDVEDARSKCIQLYEIGTDKVKQIKTKDKEIKKLKNEKLVLINALPTSTFLKIKKNITI
jgi:hypothetical protein